MPTNVTIKSLSKCANWSSHIWKVSRCDGPIPTIEWFNWLGLRHQLRHNYDTNKTKYRNAKIPKKKKVCIIKLIHQPIPTQMDHSNKTKSDWLKPLHWRNINWVALYSIVQSSFKSWLNSQFVAKEKETNDTITTKIRAGAFKLLTLW